jgi:hypothetical protein
MLMAVAIAMTICGVSLMVFALATRNENSQVVRGHSGVSSGYFPKSWGVFATGLLTSAFGASRIYLLSRHGKDSDRKTGKLSIK